MTRSMITALAFSALLAACGGDDKDSSTNNAGSGTSANLQTCQQDCWKICNQDSACNVGSSCEDACKEGDAVCEKVCYDGMDADKQALMDQAYSCAMGCYPSNSCLACAKDCAADADCRVLLTCTTACADGDDDCEAACIQAYPDGVSLATHAEQCAAQRGCE